MGRADVPGMAGKISQVTKILFVVTEDWYFISHRFALAQAALDKGIAVTVVTRISNKKKFLEEHGINVVPLSIDRSNLNPLKELFTIWQLYRIFVKEKPDIIHLVALKPVIVGGIAARLAGIKNLVFAVAGMGFLFTGRGLKNVVAKCILKLLSLLSNNGYVIVQNQEDLDLLEKTGIPKTRLMLIRGSGVDLKIFKKFPEKNGTPIVMLASRLLWDKGVREFVEAAKLLKNDRIRVRFVLVGAPDLANPTSIEEKDIKRWIKQGIVEWWGKRDDMPSVLPMAHIVCLPSYREGLPKVLLEAMACGRPCITTDVPGCRDAVIHGENGLIVPAKNVTCLAKAIEFLLEHPAERLRMGNQGRMRAKKEFSQEKIIEETFKIYKAIIK